MKSYSFIYSNKLDFKKSVYENKIDVNKNYIIQIFGSYLEEDRSRIIATEIKSVFLNSSIIGIPTSGVIYSGKIEEKSILISIMEFENTEYTLNFVNFEYNKPQELSSKINDYSTIYKNSTVIAFFTETFLLLKTLRNLNLSPKNYTLTGGMVGYKDSDGHFVSYIFDEEKIYKSTFAILVINNDKLLTNSNSIVGNLNFGEVCTVSKVENNSIFSINGIPVENWLKLELGNFVFDNIEDQDEINHENLSKFSISFNDSNNSGSYIKYDQKYNELYFGEQEIENGEEFRLTYISSFKSREEWLNSMQYFQNYSVEAIQFFICYTRYFDYKELVEWEINRFNGAHVFGGLFLAEFTTRNGKFEYLNNSSTFLTFAEKDSFIEVDIDSLNNFGLLKKFSEPILDFIKKDNANDYVNFKRIYETEIALEQKYNVNINSKFSTTFDYIKYEKHRSSCQMCFIKINQGLDKSYIDKDKLLSITDLMVNIIETIFDENMLKFYTLTTDIFYFAVNNDLNDEQIKDRLKELNTLFEKHMQLIGTKILFVNNFQNFSKVDIEFDSFKNGYIITYENQTLQQTIQHEFSFVDNLLKIIEMKTLIPYFQGIFDNKSNNYFAYEALMRIKDTKGNVIEPSMFLDIAIKYGLYGELNIIFTQIVLEYFKFSDVVISINVMISDILSQDYKSMLFKKIAELKTPSNLIIEISETCEFENYIEIKDFVRRVKDAGALVGLDEFGIGFKHFDEIELLSFDIVKIDGSLIRLIGNDVESDKILEKLLNLSDKNGIKTVAKHVETSSIQRMLIGKGIGYSQGYLLSKPFSYEDLSKEIDNVVKLNNVINIKEKTDEFELINSQVTKDKFITGLIFWTAVALAALTLLYAFVSSNSDDSVDKSYESVINTFSNEISVEMNDILFSKSDAQLEKYSSILSNFTNDIDYSYSVLETLSENSLFNSLYISTDDKEIKNSINSININQADLNKLKNSDSGVLIEKESGVLGIFFYEPIMKENKQVGSLFAELKTSYFEGFNNFDYDSTYIENTIYSQDGLLVSSTSTETMNLFDRLSTFNFDTGFNVEVVEKYINSRKPVTFGFEKDSELNLMTIRNIPNTDYILVSELVKSGLIVDLQSEANVSIMIYSSLILIFLLSAYFLIKSRQEKIVEYLKNALEIRFSLSNNLESSIETDYLTGTLSRISISEKITYELQFIEDKDYKDALIMLDVDNFKFINDTYGHGTGDNYLQELVKTIKSVLRANDMIGRIGGDEFLIYLVSVEEREVEEILRRIIHQLSLIQMKDVDLSVVGASIGYVIVPDEGNKFDVLTEKADIALYKSKNRGKRQFTKYTEE